MVALPVKTWAWAVVPVWGDESALSSPRERKTDIEILDRRPAQVRKRHFAAGATGDSTTNSVGGVNGLFIFPDRIAARGPLAMALDRQ